MKKLNYIGAGTIEFLYEDGKFLTLDSERVRAGLKSILLGPAQLYEALRAQAMSRAARYPL